jgi:hypothetical protein
MEILIGFFISFLHLVSKIFGIPIPEHPGFKNPDEASSTISSQKYNALVSSKRIGSLEPSTLTYTENKEDK